MKKDETVYFQLIEKLIFCNYKFKIQKVNNLTSLKSIYYVFEEYSDIEKLIEQNNISLIVSYPENQIKTKEFLDILTFEDQNKNKYIVTIYDSILLEQDPQIIKIYQIPR